MSCSLLAVGCGMEECVSMNSSASTSHSAAVFKYLRSRRLLLRLSVLWNAAEPDTAAQATSNDRTRKLLRATIVEQRLAALRTAPLSQSTGGGGLVQQVQMVYTEMPREPYI